MTDKRWKRLERQTARALGSERLPSNGHAQPDIIAGPFSIEHKARQTLPKWLLAAWEQATRNASAGQTPLLVLSMPRGRGRRPLRLAVMALEDFADWHGVITDTPAAMSMIEETTNAE